MEACYVFSVIMRLKLWSLPVLTSIVVDSAATLFTPETPKVYLIVIIMEDPVWCCHLIVVVDHG